MKEFIIIGTLFFFISCNSKQKEVSHCNFSALQNNVFVKASKYQGGRFVLSFSKDSLNFNNKNDFIEFKTGSYVQIVLDSTNIHVVSHGNIYIEKTNSQLFKIDTVPELEFKKYISQYKENNSFYNLITVDTKEYSIWVNGQLVKKGDIYGGW